MLCQDLRRAVALVHVEVHDEHPRFRINTRVQCRHREIIINCVAGTVRFVGVVRPAAQVPVLTCAE